MNTLYTSLVDFLKQSPAPCASDPPRRTKPRPLRMCACVGWWEISAGSDEGMSNLLPMPAARHIRVKDKRENAPGARRIWWNNAYLMDDIKENGDSFLCWIHFILWQQKRSRALQLLTARTHSGASSLLTGLNARSKFSSEDRRFNAFIDSIWINVSAFNIE